MAILPIDVLLVSNTSMHDEKMILRTASLPKLPYHWNGFHPLFAFVKSHDKPPDDLRSSTLGGATPTPFCRYTTSPLARRTIMSPIVATSAPNTKLHDVANCTVLT